MSIVTSMETLRGWMEVNVCSQVRLKLPDDDATDASFPYRLVTPAAFVMFLPTKDRLPPSIPAPIPSLCAQLIGGTDSVKGGTRKLQVRLWLSAWDPGTHGPDYYKPKGNSSGSYIRWYNEEAKAFFQKNGDGWQDAWNFADTAVRALENNDYIGGLRILKEDGIQFGPAKEQDTISDYYPFWYAWIEFSVEEALVRAPQANLDF